MKHNILIFRILLLSIFLGTSQNSFSQLVNTNHSSPTLQLQNRQLQLQRLGDEKTIVVSGKYFSEKELVFVQTNNIKAAGSILQQESYLGNGVYLCSTQKGLQLSDLKKSGITAWAEVLPEDKLSVHLNDIITDEESTITTMTQFSKNNTEEEINQLLKQFNASKEQKQPWFQKNIYFVKLSSGSLQKLATQSAVLFIQPKFEPELLRNSQAVGFTNARIAQQPINLGGYNLQGQGMTVGIGDDDNPSAIDYNDRLISFNAVRGSDHATHTTGTVGSAGIVDERYRGFAPKARLISDFFSQMIENAAIYVDNFNMIAANHSYGIGTKNCNFAGTYDAYSAILDQQAFELPHLLHCFAAGNDGRITCGLYPKSYGTVLGAYATAKNVLTVGAIGFTRDIIPDFSSRGPVKDGRLKPEIAAVGYQLVSNIRNNLYFPNNGTSMATPNVTGAATLLHQRYKELHSDFADNALIKTLLMNGADDIMEPGPDFHYGFGLMNLRSSLIMLDSNQYEKGSIQNTEKKVHNFNIPANTSVAKIMLYWNDPEASPLAKTALVNDLDLTVKDPQGNIHLPLILNTTQTKIKTFAKQGKDHLNNVEQVTLYNPQPGKYAIQVEGYNIPENAQDYYIAYSFIPEGISFQYPLGGEAFSAGDSTYVYWQASGSNEVFSLSFSSDNGNNWQVLDNSIGTSKRAYLWKLPENISSGKCMLKLQRGTEIVATKSFTIIGRPILSITEDSTQCPGSIHFSWNSVRGATQYLIYQKIGPEMVVIDSINKAEYTIYGLSADSTYWIAVAPQIDGNAGMRSVALSYQPNKGNCSNVTIHGDLRLTKVLHPSSGRQFTQSIGNLNNPLTILVHNADNNPAANFSISWKINNQSWQSQNISQSIAHGGFETINTLPQLNVSDTGDYTIVVALSNLGNNDPIKNNDTQTIFVRNLPNNQIDLNIGFVDSFEHYPTLTLKGKNLMGFGNSTHWDFETDRDYGRIRTFVNSGITIEGQKSISLDNAVTLFDSLKDYSSQNLFTGTFNLNGYQANNDEVRTTFEYFMSGVPTFDSGNQVWVRGNELQPWLPFYTYQIDTLNLGALFHSGSLSLSDLLNENGQNFSSATQIRFGQKDTSQIGSSYFGNGLTMDNFSLYSVFNDIAVIGINSLKRFNCALSNALPVSITVKNTVRNSIYNIPVSYQIDSMPPVTEIIDSIPGKTSITFQFQTTADLSNLGDHLISVWTEGSGDSYALNDSVIDFKIRNQPVIDSFPYYQDFEENDGYFYSEGMNNSWEYGIPHSKLKHAASGKKIWKTGLDGAYNSYELSYLYSPCFDLSNLEKPTLSFSLSTNIENNPDDSTFYDQAFMEYSTDGVNWLRLDDTTGTAVNWYNNGYARAWTKENEIWWKVVTVPLPKANGTLALRFVLKTDPGANLEGIGVDDIHIYDLKIPIFKGDSLANPLVQNIGMRSTRVYSYDNNYVAEVKNEGSAIGNTLVQRYLHNYFINQDSTQYFLPENFVIQSASSPDDSMELSLYLLDAAMQKIRDNQECPSCTPIKEIYRMGVTQYSDNNKKKENNTLSDNKAGNWNYIPWDKIRYIPYADGYIAKFKVNHLSEIWFNSGGPDQNAALNEHLFDFTAAHFGERAAELKWSSKTDANTVKYYVQRTDTNWNFQIIAEINSLQQNNYTYTFIDTPQLYQTQVLYRLLFEGNDGNTYSSIFRSVDWTSGDKGNVWIYPNPSQDGQLNLAWFKGNYDPLNWYLYDNSGKLIQHGVTKSNPVSGREVIPLNRWGIAPGLYLLKVVTPLGKWTFKVVYQP